MAPDALDPWGHVEDDRGRVPPADAPVEGDPWAHTEDIRNSPAAAAAPAPLAGSTIKNWDQLPESDITAGQALKAGVANFIPSAVRDIAGMGHAIAHPIETGSALLDVGKGLYSKMEGAAGVQQDPVDKAKTEAAADAAGKSVSDSLGSWQGIKHSFANDPFSWATNLVPAVGGAAKLAKGAGLLGDAGDAAAAAKAAEAAAAAKTLSNPAVAAALQKIEPSIGIADLSPDAQKALADAVTKKGVSEASVKEGLAAHAATTVDENGVRQAPQIPTAVTTGQAAAAGTENAVGMAKLLADKNAADNLGKLGNPTIGDAHPTALAETLQDKLIANHNAISDAYKGIESVPGTAPRTLPGGVTQVVDQTLPKALGASGIGDLRKLNGLPQTVGAYDKLQELLDHFTTVQKAAGEEGLDASQLNLIRQDLGSFYQGAKGSDYHGVGALIDGFDNGVARSLRNNSTSFEGQGARVADQLDATRQLFKDQKNTFFNAKDRTKAPLKSFAEGVMEGAVKDGATGKITAGAGPDKLQTLQEGLSKSLLPNKGLPQGNVALHGHLMDAFGEDRSGAGYSAPSTPGGAALNDHIKDSIFAGATNKRGMGSTLAHDPSKMHDMLGTDLAQRAIKPETLSHARVVNLGRRIINAPPVAGGKIGPAFRHAATGAIVQGGMGWLGHKIGGIPGAIAGMMVEPHIEHLMNAYRASHALSGAPNARSAAVRAAVAAAKAPVKVPVAALKHASRALPQDVSHLVQAAQRPTRARGGKVGHQHLVDRLFQHVERAKREEKAHTSSLLHHPDTAIAKALNAAQKAI